MSDKSKNILMLCVWGLLSIAKYYDLIFDETFQPNIVDWFILIVGPIMLVYYILALCKLRKNK